MKTRNAKEMKCNFTYLPNLTSVTACTTDCNPPSESYNNIGCTANKSVPPQQWQVKFDDEKLYLFLGAFYCFIIIITLQ